MSHTIATAVVALSLVAFTAPATDTWDLKPAALAAFDRYVRLTEVRMDGETSFKTSFLWIDRQPTNAVLWRARDC